MSPIRFNPIGVPVSSSQSISASVCLSAEPLNIPSTASYAEWADSPSGSNGLPVVRTVVGNVVLISTPPPGPTPTPEPECPLEDTILREQCDGKNYVRVYADGTCDENGIPNEYQDVLCFNTAFYGCGGDIEGCGEPE
jgi:hypothetical protein